MGVVEIEFKLYLRQNAMEISSVGQKSICLPTLSEADYAVTVQNRNAFRTYLDQMIAAYPELFPASIEDGYWLYGVVLSKKLDLSTRRIKLKATGAVYQLRPDFSYALHGWED